ncbi:MAG: diaminopimelate epimerase [Candidatus Omnitrophica bacterium]|nr:diaminopimelate epimerase [Candidatus Omnitrophota bacterium]
MGKIEFYKLQASGNDFVLIDTRYSILDAKVNYKKLAQGYCKRKLGIGGDGLLIIGPSKVSDFKMRIFNPDGSEAEMCGNGARCVAFYSVGNQKREARNRVKFETKAGVIEAEVRGQRAEGRGQRIDERRETKDEGRQRLEIRKQKAGERNWEEIRVKITDPFDLKLNLPLKVLGRRIKVNFINTGVPHAVIFVEGLDMIDVENIGRAIRFHKRFFPAGTNVNFVEFLKDKRIKLRTYERGVEAETLACGTGVVASAVIANYRLFQEGKQITGCRVKTKVETRSKEVLNVCFNREGNKISDVWLEGKAYLVYKGEIEI